jgi:hypothetical protein
MMSSEDNGAAGLGCLILLAIPIAIVYFSYQGVVSSGWMPHTVETQITAQQNWLVGETKECLSTPLDAEVARSLGKPNGYALSHISCDDGPEHTIKVNFYGAGEQPDRSWLSWKCTRNSEDFTCKQTGSSPVILKSHDVNSGRPIVSYDSGKTWTFTDNP